MMTALKIFWSERNERERQLLAVMGALLLIVVLWLGYFRPVAAAHANAQTRLDRVSAESGQIASRIAALKDAARTPPAPLGGTIATVVAQAGSEAGFTLNRIDAQGDDRVVIAIPAAKSTVLFTWLNTLARRGIFAERIAVRTNSDATVAVEATLRVRRP